MVKVIKKKKNKSAPLDLNRMLAEAMGFHQSGNLEDAESHYLKMISSDSSSPCNAAAHNNLANILKARGNFNEAIDHYERAILLNPGSAETCYNLGNSFSTMGRLDEAVEQYHKAILIKPGFAEAYNDLANILKKEGMYEEAIKNYKNAISINPDLAVAHNNLGDAYKEIGCFNEAIAHCERAITLQPESAGLYVNFGNVMHKQGSIQEAITHYKRAVELSPDYSDAHFNLGIVLLTKGEFEEGWKEYGWRFKSKEIADQIDYRDMGVPEWDGQSLNGRTILIKSEQGIGDQIQFARYIPKVKEKGGRVVFECHKELFPLFELYNGIDRLVEKPYSIDCGENPDVCIQLINLPGIFGTNLNNIISNVPYLKAGSGSVNKWQSRFNANLINIGIVWAGNPNHGNDRNRSCKLEDFDLLASIPGVALFSLQKRGITEDSLHLPSGVEVADLGGDLKDFGDTAAIIECLDLVITVDTSVAHLAGALGKDVWTVLPYIPDWRWMLDRDDSPWYPTMRLYRQHEKRNWQNVFSRILEDLKKYINKSD